MKLELGRGDRPEAGRGYPAPWEASAGTQVAVPVDGDALRLVVAWFADGGRLRWPDDHGEEALYVLEGAVAVDGRTVPAGGAVILHADAAGELVAIGGARVAHFSVGAGAGARDGSPAASEPYHLLGPGGWYRSGSPGGSQATWFADSTCPACDVTLLRVERDTPGNRGRAHSHSADEILFLVEGGIRLGAHEIPTGHAVFVPADTRYAVTCGPVKHGFLNYRARASLQRYEGDTEPMVENGLGRGGDVVADFIC